MDLKSGDVISHYQIVDCLGTGGMGVVYRAEDLKLGRNVALKFLPPDATILPHAKERFIHEARAVSALDHPNICTIHEISETEEGQLFLVMSCYEGETLRAKLERGRLDIEESTRIAVQVCNGLAAAHEKSIVHRDLKPDNIMILTGGLVKILDFGLAKLAGQTVLTTEGSTLGTAAYMSPEQTRSEEVDARTDIYSLSVILYEMLTGALPFKADHQLAVLYQIVNVPPALPRSINPAIPEELEQIILKGMSKEREKRYPNSSAMEEELLPFAGAEFSLSGVHKSVPHPAGKGTAGQQAEKLLHSPLRRLVPYAALALVAIVVAAYALYFFSTPHRGSDRSLARTHLDKAISLMSDNQLPEAKLELESALAADPSYPSAWSTMAAVSIRLRNLDTAIAQSKKSLELDRRNVDGYYNLAYALEEKGDLNDALVAYSEAVKIDSNFIPAQSALGNILLRLDSADRAIDVLKHSLQIEPASRYAYLVYRNLGRAYLRAGKPDESIAALQKSIQVQPSQEAEPLRILASAYQTKGMLREARSELQKYLSLETDAQKRQEARTLLQQLTRK